MSLPVLTPEQIAGSREAVFGDDDELLDVTAYLDDAIKLPGLVGDYLTGRITSDLLERYPDGLRIHTSYIVKELQPDVFLTRSRNVYRIRTWREAT